MVRVGLRRHQTVSGSLRIEFRGFIKVFNRLIEFAMHSSGIAPSEVRLGPGRLQLNRFSEAIDRPGKIILVEEDFAAV